MSRTVQTLSLRHLGLTLLLVRMTATQVKAWSWVGDMWDGTTPVEGYEVRDTTGGLLGVILPLGHQAARLHAEWSDPASGDFYAAGETPAAVLTQGASYVLQQYAWHVGAVPPGEGFTLGGSRYHHRPGRCPFGYCFDLECVDHASVCAPAASAA